MSVRAGQMQLLISEYLTLNASSIDLPAATRSSDAETDKQHGLTFKVCYTQDAGNETASISVSSVLTYTLFLNTNRTVSFKTGTATISHNANLN